MQGEPDIQCVVHYSYRGGVLRREAVSTLCFMSVSVVHRFTIKLVGCTPTWQLHVTAQGWNERKYDAVIIILFQLSLT